ncbi:CDP-glycerol glycerophosphotransferase family protein [Citrobacter gillenii]|jgi:CDP-glycerol glycerophosphotransferase (TagB/SpsB family)|uniref:CDP-glycerol glycerophosphotransferase family protein n=1 Tax=Citrobacter gillenii TaxID=67828 RepID=UPI00311CC61E
MRKIIKYINKLLLWVIYPIGYLFKRDGSIWVFGGYGGFTDNTRYLYESVNQHDDIRCIWISDKRKLVDFIRSKGYEAYTKNSIKGLYFCFKAKVYIYSNYVSTINFYTSAGAVLVNLWHGTPLKKIEYDIQKLPLYSYFKGANFFIKLLMPEKHVKCSLILSPSSFVYEYSFKTAFRVFDPRCVIIADPPRISNLIEKYNKKITATDPSEGKVSKVFLYAPTWRDDRSDFISASGMDFDELDSFLLLNNALLYIRLHPNTNLCIDISKLNNIVIVDCHQPVEDNLLNSDFLITDYSSIYFDYLYLNKPIIFFPFDLYEYTASRDLYLKYEDVTPGIKVFTQKELISEMRKLLDGEDSWAKSRSDISSKFCSLERRGDTYIIKRVQEYIYDNQKNIQ